MISHGAQNELAMLHALGYKFSTNIYIVDTFLVAKEAFGYCEYSLNELFCRTQCPFNNLHTGGNDAHFTLKACLLLALYKSENNENTETLTNYLRVIATSNIPYRADPQVKAARKKGQRDLGNTRQSHEVSKNKNSFTQNERRKKQHRNEMPYKRNMLTTSFVLFVILATPC
ncbi:hypothetical protein F5Y12DRAFT_14776 [Xylaria sp. FL1777]|nr:hypothetical protein F5Y12DRAFT_14776 [Xylaria sp. FL1777]